MSFIYCFYQLNSLTLDKDNVYSESKTLKGFIRSLLEGGKYNKISTALPLLILFVSLAIALSYVFPVVGTEIAMSIGFSFGFICIINGHSGFLGGAHFIQSCWHQLKNRIYPPKSDHSIAKMLPTPENSSSFSSLKNKGITSLSEPVRATNRTQEVVNRPSLFENPITHSFIDESILSDRLKAVR